MGDVGDAEDGHGRSPCLLLRRAIRRCSLATKVTQDRETSVRAGVNRACKMRAALPEP